MALLGPLAVLSLAAGAPALADSTGHADPVTVHMQADGFRFCAASAAACTPLDDGAVTVPVGSTVVWTYTDRECDAVPVCPGHNVEVTGGKSGQTRKQDGAVLLSETFTQPGTFAYICSIHAPFGMTGKVIVQGTAAPPASGTASSAPARTVTSSPTQVRTKKPATTPTAPARQLAFTGLDAIGPVLAVLSLLGAFVAMRRREAR